MISEMFSVRQGALGTPQASIPIANRSTSLKSDVARDAATRLHGLAHLLPRILPGLLNDRAMGAGLVL